MDEDAAAYLEITRLQRTYGDVCTRRAWDELADLCAPDARFSFDFGVGAPVELLGPSALTQFGAGAVERFSFYQYVVLNAVVTAETPTAAHGRVDVLEIGVDDATGQWQEFYGRYLDEYVRLDRAWRFARRQYGVTARRTDAGVDVFPGPR